MGLPQLAPLEEELPVPNRSGFTWATSELCKIIHSIHRLYHNHKTSVIADLRAAYHIAMKLQVFAQEVNDNLQIQILSDTKDYSEQERVKALALSLREYAPPYRGTKLI